MAVRGVERYNRITASHVDAGRESETTYAKRLIPEYVRCLAEGILKAQDPVTGWRGGSRYINLLRGVEPEQAAYITLRYVFDSLVKGDTVNNLAITLGTRIEDQLRFSKFEEEHREYYRTIIEDFKNKGTVSYQHRHRVLGAKSVENNVAWNCWKPEERLHLGCKLLEICVETTGLITKATHFVSPHKSEVRVVATEETLAWINEHKEHAELLNPETMPCVIPPCDWVSLNDGGYYTPEIRHKVTFIKIKSRAHRLAVKGHDFSEAMQAVNAIQRTAWAVNTKVHDVMKEVWKRNLGIGMPASSPLVVSEAPVPKGMKKEEMTDKQVLDFMQWKRAASRTYTAERERFSKCLQLSRVMQMAEKFRDKEFWYVYNCDFRGRIYCASPGLSPQGADFSKGLLHFSNGKRLGTNGAYWLAVHGANTYGYDKASYDDRREWVNENADAIAACAADPLDGAARSFWADADKPWQFLAFCFEWAQYKALGDAFESRLAVALDGSCNGLQNFSAMLRDTTGARATNLAPGLKPEDIYAEVARVCTAELQKVLDAPEVHGEEDAVRADLIQRKLAAQWLQYGITRKCTKRPVMTLPYGSTRQSCRDYIEDYVLENLETSPWNSHTDIFVACTFLSKYLWDSIGHVVVAAREAMQFLQKTSRVLSGANIPMSWESPTGFKVYQGTMQNQSVRVKTQLCGLCYLSVASPTLEVDSRKQALGVAPNFVHSMDAAHLIKTVGLGEDITAWWMIHDSYGTYAADTDRLHRCIRSAFVGMYQRHDVIQEFNTSAEQAIDSAYEQAAQEEHTGVMQKLEKLVLPEIPQAGNFDLAEVMQASYFFG